MSENNLGEHFQNFHRTCELLETKGKHEVAFRNDLLYLQFKNKSLSKSNHGKYVESPDETSLGSTYFSLSHENPNMRIIQSFMPNLYQAQFASFFAIVEISPIHVPVSCPCNLSHQILIMDFPKP